MFTSNIRKRGDLFPVTLIVAWLFVPDGQVEAFQKLLISWDLNENGVKSSQCEL